MCRDKWGSWLPVAHAFLSNPSGELIQRFLLIVKKWAPKWQARYVITADSASEIQAFREAFPGPEKGQSEVSDVSRAEQ